MKRSSQIKWLGSLTTSLSVSWEKVRCFVCCCFGAGGGGGGGGGGDLQWHSSTVYHHHQFVPSCISQSHSTGNSSAPPPPPPPTTTSPLLISLTLLLQSCNHSVLKCSGRTACPLPSAPTHYTDSKNWVNGKVRPNQMAGKSDNTFVTNTMQLSNGHILNQQVPQDSITTISHTIMVSKDAPTHSLSTTQPPQWRLEPSLFYSVKWPQSSDWLSLWGDWKWGQYNSFLNKQSWCLLSRALTTKASVMNVGCCCLWWEFYIHQAVQHAKCLQPHICCPWIGPTAYRSLQVQH